jgi:hypothetical protein
MMSDDSHSEAAAGVPAGHAGKSRAHRLRNAAHTVKLHLALLEHELRGTQVSDGAQRAVAAVRMQIDNLASLAAELAVEAKEEG